MSSAARIAFRVVKVYSGRSGFQGVYETDDFTEALVAREAADNASTEEHFIIAYPQEDSGSSYDGVIKALGMVSR